MIKKITLSTLKWLNWTILLPLLTALLISVFFVFSNSGLRLSIYWAERYVPALQVGQINGSLLGGFHLQQLQYHDNDLQFQLAHFIFEPRLQCVFTLQLCVKELTLDGLALSLTTEVNEPITPPPATADNATGLATFPIATSFVLPFPASIERLQLNNVRLQLGDEQLSWNSFNTTMSGWGSRVQLDNSQLQQLTLQLAESENDTDTLAFSYQAPEIILPAIPLTVMLNQTTVTDISVIRGNSQQWLEQFDFSLQLTPRQLRLFDLSVQHSMATLQGEATLQLTDALPLTASFNAEITESTFAGLLLSLQLSGSLRQLDIQLDSSQLIDAKLQGQFQLLTDELPFTLSLGAKTLPWPLNTTPDIALIDTQLQLSGNVQQQKIALLTQLRQADLPHISLSSSGQFTLATGQLDLQQYQINLLGGQVLGKAKLNLTATPHWHTDLSLSQLQPGLFWPQYQGQLSGQLQHRGALASNGQLSLLFPNIALQGVLRDYPLDINGMANFTADKTFSEFQISTDGLQLQHGKNSIALQGQLAKHWQLSAAIDIAELGHSLAGAAGKINATLAVSGPQRYPIADIQLNAQQLAYTDVALQQFELNGQLAVAEQLQVNLALSAVNGQYQDYKLHQLTLELTGNEHAHMLSASFDSSEGQVTFDLAGKLQQRELWQASLNTSSINSILGPWQLTAPFNIDANISSGQLSLAAHCWQQELSRLCFTEPAQLSADMATVHLQLEQFELATLEPFIPYHSQISGKFDAAFSTQWQAGQLPRLELQVTGGAGQLQYQFESPVLVPWQQWQLNSVLTEGVYQHTNTAASHEPLLQSQLQIDFNPQSQLKVNATIGELLSDDRQLSAQLLLNQFTLDFLKPLLDEFSELKGIFSSDIRLSGSLLNPFVQGEAALQGFRLKGKLAPADIDDANINLRFKGEHAQLDGQFRTPEGELALTGSANWQDLNDWQALLQLTGDELRLQVPNAQLRVKPDLKINASPQLINVSGIIQIPRADINIDSLPQNAVTISSDVVLLDKHLQPMTIEQKATIPLQLDVRLQLGQRVQLSAFGLKTRLAGELRVQQQAQQSQPRVNGDVVLVDGTFRSYGQDLLIRQGKMTFTGPADQPFLSVEAIRNPANMEDDVIAGIRVTGPADEPQISIFSEPAKPQANALSYLLMGRDLDSESGSAANAITTSLIGLSIAQSGKVLGDIGEAFGVRDLTLDTEGAGDASQVTVSGYLTRNLQLKYGVGIFEPIGQFTLRYRLLRSLYIEAVSGVDNAVDILYKFEFD